MLPFRMKMPTAYRGVVAMSPFPRPVMPPAGAYVADLVDGLRLKS